MTLQRLTFSMMALAEAVQTKGLGSRLYEARNSSMLAINSGTLRNTPRRIRFWVSSRNQRSTRFSHEELVGVKCS